MSTKIPPETRRILERIYDQTGIGVQQWITDRSGDAVFGDAQALAELRRFVSIWRRVGSGMEAHRQLMRELEQLGAQDTLDMDSDSV